MRNLFWSLVGWFAGGCLTLILSGCASIGVPQSVVKTNIPWLVPPDTITVYNSAGPNILLVPQSSGGGFVEEYREGKRTSRTLWLTKEKIVTKVVTLALGESLTVPLYRNTTGRTINVPMAVRVYEDGKVIGFYNRCFAVRPLQSQHFDFNFGPRELAELKRGRTGRPCGGYW